MKTFYALLIISSLSLFYNGYSQSKYGKITEEELGMTSYPEDTTASAVVLLKKGDSRFVLSAEYGFRFEYTLQMKIKILKTEGLDWCNQEIPYYVESNSSKEMIDGLSGTTYNLENGKIVKTKLSKEYITEENQDDKYRLRKFTMPAAKVGSVIEYKYTIVSDFFYNLREFQFQETIPVAYSYFETTIPEYFVYNINFQGYIRLNSKREPGYETFLISGERIQCNAEKIQSEVVNVPAMKEEAYLWSSDDYISKITFELRSVNMPMSTIKNFSSSWANIDNELLAASDFGGNTKKTGLFEDEIKKGEITIERAGEIQSLIKSKVKLNDSERSSIVPRDMKEALKTGLGNNGDMNFLLINALKAGGFDAFPVVLSTRKNGRLPFSHPSMSAFNYVITGLQIDTVMYFTDAAAKYGDWNLLPEGCMVSQAHIIRPNACDWVNLTTISTGLTMKTAKAGFSGNEYVAKITDSRKGNSAYHFKYQYNNAKDEEAFIESLSAMASAEIDSFKISGMDETSQMTKMEYIQKAKIGVGEDFLYINPLIYKQFSDNPFKDETREYPINFNYPETYIQVVEIKIPEGYTVEELPQSTKLVMNDTDITLIYRVMQNGNTVNLHYQFQLKRLTFMPTEYDAIKDFFAKLVAKNSEQIVLKKVSIQ